MCMCVRLSVRVSSHFSDQRCAWERAKHTIHKFSFYIVLYTLINVMFMVRKRRKNSDISQIVYVVGNGMACPSDMFIHLVLKMKQCFF